MAKSPNSKLSSNWAYKLAAIVAAVLIWIFITISTNPPADRQFTVSVETRGLAQNLAMDKTDYQVNVRVQGPAAAVNNLSLSDIEAYIDFTGLLAGEVTVEVITKLPENNSAQIVSQNLKSITVELKEKRAGIFPLTVDVQGKVADGFERLEAKLSPAEVRLRGTEDYLRMVDKVFVTASVQDIEDSFDKDLAVMVLDAAGNDITTMFTIEPKVARVVIPVMSKQPEKTLAVQVPITGEPALGYKLSLFSVSPSTVRVYGDLSRLQGLSYVETEPLDISGMRYDDSFTLDLNLGNGFSSDRSQVTVAVKIEPVNYANFTKTLVLSDNVAEGLLAEVEQQSLQITVYGPETFIATLSEADVVPYVDCADLEPGLYSLPIRVALPANIQLMNISVDTVEVNIYDVNANVQEGEPLPEEATPPEESGGGQ